MIFGIILAAGKGSRMKVQGANKTTVAFEGKPLVQYGIDLFEKTTHRTVLVVGAFADSIKKTARIPSETLFAYQTKRLGTGHAVMVAVKEIEGKGLSPEVVLIGYGDHMMFYTPEIISQLVSTHKMESADVSFLTTEYHDPNSLAWGRIVRDAEGNVLKIVEQKDATDGERDIKEVNPGFYCVKYSFLKQALRKMKKSPVTGEYYLTELTEIAMKQNKKIATLLVPFEYVGLGINTHEQLQQSQALYEQSSSDSLSVPL
jgi:bifunctional UDP-N-acetylglucosamine pyrophosphorylase/glucosamine-1-phosphate N-acetyltransferase